MKIFLWLLFFVAVGLIVEQIVKRRVLASYFRFDNSNSHEMGQIERLKASVANELPDIIGLFLFF